MGTMRTEYIYTTTGPQRPVFLGPDGADVRYTLDIGLKGAASVQVTHDPVEQVARGRAQWEDGGHLAAGVYGVTAMRVVIKRVDGWVTLVIERGTEGETHDRPQ